MNRALQIPIILNVLMLLLSPSCGPAGFQKKTIVYVNSYHRGHPSSDEIMDGIVGSFDPDSFEIITYFMDTKRNTSVEYIELRAIGLSDSIIHNRPDILIVSDDNAVKYLVKPHLLGQPFPVVFCGINMSAEEYDLPAEKTTGMLEILPIEDLLVSMKTYFPHAGKLLLLSENTTTSRKEAVLLDTLFSRLGIEASTELVNDFDQWKNIFSEANSAYDIIYFVTNAAIKGWDHEEAVSFITRYLKVPVITCEDFMMPYAVFGLTKVAAEQGLWAAGTAKKILHGTSPADIPVTRNQLSTKWLNITLAEMLGICTDSVMTSDTKVISFHASPSERSHLQ